MRKDPAEVFDIDEIASRNLEEAHLRAKALDLALRLCQWHETPPGLDMAVLQSIERPLDFAVKGSDLFLFVDGKTLAASNPLDVQWMSGGERAATPQEPGPVVCPGVLTTGGNRFVLQKTIIGLV